MLRAMLMSDVWHDCVILCRYTKFRYKELQHTSPVENPFNLDATFFSEKTKKKHFPCQIAFFTSLGYFADVWHN